MLSTRTTSCIVVETRRGAGAKFTYDPDVGTLTVTSARALGITYMPSTVAEDCDPVDALAVHDIGAV
jgi:inorganic pyrophosphatase